MVLSWPGLLAASCHAIASSVKRCNLRNRWSLRENVSHQDSQSQVLMLSYFNYHRQRYYNYIEKHTLKDIF